MRFNDRKEFSYDPDLFSRQDTQVALRMHHEYIQRGAARPTPKFFEIDISSGGIDPLWHQPIKARQPFTRTLDIPWLVQFEKPEWRVTSLGLTPQQRYRFWLSNISLRLDFDYFPCRGDLVLWNGYRLMITEATIDPSAFWGQTNVWLGLVVNCHVVPEGDSRPLADLQLTPQERSTSAVKP